MKALRQVLSFCIALGIAACFELPACNAQPGQALPPAAPAPSAPLPHPADIYRQAMHPLDVVRSSLDNWSDSELSALVVAMRVARQACAEARPESYAGDDLYDLARVCSLGQQWGAANAIALQYIASGAEPHRTQAYVLSMNALMSANDTAHAMDTALQMLHKVPYDAEVALAIRSIKTSLEESPSSLALALEERAALATALSGGTALKAVHGEASIGAGDLYESGLQLAYMESYRHADAEAKTTVAQLDAALAKAPALSAADRLQIDAAHRRYALLGQRLPAFEIQKSLFSPTAKAAIDPQTAAATALVLFPDWCAQCRKMMKTLTEFAAVNADTPIHAYGLMFAERPEQSGTPLPTAAELTTSRLAPSEAAEREEIEKELQGTATMIVPASTAQIFAATDYPLGILVDSAGTVRSIGVIPLDAFKGDGFMEKAILARVIEAGETPQIVQKKP